MYGGVLHLRGGASKRRSGGKAKVATLNSSKSSRTATGKKKVGSDAEKNKKTSALESGFQKYKKILPLTRIQITLIATVTLVGSLLGEELAQAMLALDPTRVLYGFELWRPFTAASFLGPPSLGWLMTGYWLFEYGSSLERAYGKAQHLIFLLTQITILSSLCMLLGLPFYTDSLITAMLHVLSRATPHQKVGWLLFKVPMWALPLAQMSSDVLQAKSGMAALPGILGILGGHFYHFHKFIWPKMGGEDWLVAPEFLMNKLDRDATKKEAKETVSAALKTRRKRGTGRKLGGGK